MEEPSTPQWTFDFEHEIGAKLREAGRKVGESTYNAAEEEDAQVLPTRVRLAGQE